MGVKLQTNGQYGVSFHKRHPITNKPVSLKRRNIKTKAQAERVYRELILKVEESFRKKVVPAWASFLDEYFEHAKVSGLSNMTVYNRERVLRRHTQPIWNERLVNEISTEDIRRLLSERLGPNAESHRKFFIKCVRGAFQYALERNFVLRNPTPQLKFKLSDKIRGVLNCEQILTLLRKAQELDWPWYPHYFVALFTGLRNGEMYALTWDKVNLEKRQILVNCSWSSKDGLKSTKSGDDRIVEIPLSLLPLLNEMKLQSFDCEYVLPRLSKWDKGEQARELRLFLKSLALPEIRFHDLRASWATMLLSNGVAASKVMAMGGWKDMDTMMIYMRKAGIDIQGATHVLDGMQVHGASMGVVLEMR